MHKSATKSSNGKPSKKINKLSEHLTPDQLVLATRLAQEHKVDLLRFALKLARKNRPRQGLNRKQMQVFQELMEIDPATAEKWKQKKIAERASVEPQ